jgi:hypothetical protein
LSQFPQRVLADILVTWDRHANGVPVVTFTRHGTVVDVVPGSALAGAYGGPGNLSGVLPARQRGNEQALSKAAVSN